MIWIILYAVSVIAFFITATVAINKDTIKEKYPLANPQFMYMLMAIFSLVWPLAMFVTALSTAVECLSKK